MLPRTFLTQLIPARLAEALRRVERQIWAPLPSAKIVVEQTGSFSAHRRARDIEPGEFARIEQDSFHWGPKYAQRWFRLRLPAPETEKTRYLQWRDQAEATLYVGSVPYFGLDLAHPYCPLPSGTDEVLVESVCIRSGVWLDGRAAPLADQGSLFTAPLLVTRNEAAWTVYHDLRVLLDVMEAEHADWQPGAHKAITDPVRHSPAVWRASPLFRRWCARLDAAVDVLDRKGLGEFGAELARLYAEFPAGPGELRAVLTGHAHIDLVWLWPEAVGEFKTIHTWATQVRLLEAYPEFRFGFSQTAAYDAVRARAPELHAQVQNLIRAGRWEATGGGYVEADTQLPCGEGLLRCLRLGQERFRELRGSPAAVFWLPDVFGYTAALPQLLRAFGIRGFFTTKLSWSSVNRFPHTSFRWRGADGAEVVAHVVLLHDYNEAVSVRNLREDALHHQQAAVHPEFLVPTGYGDGGGGPTAEMCERARRVRNLAGVPPAEWGGIEDFFSRLERVAEQLPVVAGELPLELHRGVFTTHSRLKAAFRGLERALQVQEAAHVAAGKGPIPARNWARMCFSQFHDNVPGSSIWEVYAEQIPELERLARSALQDAAGALESEAGEAGWFNPLPLPRLWVEGRNCYRLPALGGGAVQGLPRHALPRPEASRDTLRSHRVRADFDEAGGLKCLSVDGVDVALTGRGHHLCAYPDNPAMFEAWDVDRQSLVSGADAEPTGAAVVEVCDLSAAVTFSYRFGRSSTVAVRYSVNGDEPVLRVNYEVDWREPATLLKAVFSTRYVGKQARFGTPFGSVLRGQWPGYEREEASWEVPASRWMTVMDDAQMEGLAILSEAKYGFTVRDGVVGVSLLRSALVTEADAHAAIRETPDRPRFSDLGRHGIELALGRFFPGQPLEMQPAMLADILFTPCLPIRGGAVESGLAGLTGAASLVPSWAEPLADGLWGLRLHETLGRRGQATLHLSPGWRAAPMSLVGQPPDTDHPSVWIDREAVLSFEPYQILSVALARSPGSHLHRSNHLTKKSE